MKLLSGQQLKYLIHNDTYLNLSNNNSNSTIANCRSISDYRMNSVLMMLAVSILIFISSFSIKRQKLLLNVCHGRPGINYIFIMKLIFLFLFLGLLSPVDPFRMTNRFSSAIVFAIIIFEILDIFEGLIFRTTSSLNRGILIELLDSFLLIFLVG